MIRKSLMLLAGFALVALFVGIMTAQGQKDKGPDRAADKLSRDMYIWSHLAGDTVQRLKFGQRIIAQAA